MGQSPLLLGAPLTDSKLGFCTRFGADGAQVGVGGGVDGGVVVAVGFGVNVATGSEVRDGLGVRVGVEVGVAFGSALRDGVGLGVGVGVRDGVAVPVGVAVASEPGVLVGVGAASGGAAARLATGHASGSATTHSARRVA